MNSPPIPAWSRRTSGVSAAVLAVLVGVSGCSRSFYRNSADGQVYSILNEKTQDPRWRIPNYSAQPQPQSRFFDPTSPDCPPLPPDDPAARQYMQCVYGMRGPKLWTKLPQVDFVENPAWPDFLRQRQQAIASGDVPEIRDLTLVSAVELSLVHSREFQTQLENLYLAALNLTFERYLFWVRPSSFLGEPGSFLFYQHQPNDRSHVKLGPSHVGVRKMLPAGGQLIAELANDTIWLFSGPNSSGTATRFTYALVQPLLRKAGREIALENLTQSERSTLYAVRDFARFRKEFFVNLITGGQVAGLQRFLRGFEFLAAGNGAPSVGFFPLLLRTQQLRNRAAIVRTLEGLIEELRETDAAPLDIVQLESSLAEALDELIEDTRLLNDRIDQYKVQLGLPPDVEMTLNDSLLEPFEFTDPTIYAVEDRLRELGRQLRSIPQPIPPDRQAPLLEEIEKLASEIDEAAAEVQSDFRALEEALPERLQSLDSDDSRRQLQADIGAASARFGEVRSQLQQRLIRLRNLIERGSGAEPAPEGQGGAVSDDAPVLVELAEAVSGLNAVQISIRVELIPMRAVRLTEEEAVRIAVATRLDLMNQRARVVDGRRQLEIAADDLEGTLDLVGEGSVRTRPLEVNKHPFDFRADESEYRLGIAVTTPLDRLQERNNYRAAQIAYQRARRNYMAFEDQIKLGVRQEARTLKALEQQIEIDRRAIRLAANELDLAQQQGEGAQRGLSLSRALDNVLNAEDNLIEDWLDYESTRLNLYRDMGTMEIDRRGLWTDPYYQQLARGENTEPDGDAGPAPEVIRLPPPE